MKLTEVYDVCALVELAYTRAYSSFYNLFQSLLPVRSRLTRAL